jgi:hypothetical protein
MEEGKIATVWAQFDATERSPSMYIRMRATLSNTLLAWGRLVNLPFVNQPVVLLAIERSGNGRREDSNGLGTWKATPKKSINVYKNAVSN